VSLAKGQWARLCVH